jgi:hypothetical protein
MMKLENITKDMILQERKKDWYRIKPIVL